jgi:hypothetical protein
MAGRCGFPIHSSARPSDTHGWISHGGNGVTNVAEQPRFSVTQSECQRTGWAAMGRRSPSERLLSFGVSFAEGRSSGIRQSGARWHIDCGNCAVLSKTLTARSVLAFSLSAARAAPNVGLDHFRPLALALGKLGRRLPGCPLACHHVVGNQDEENGNFFAGPPSAWMHSF